VHNLITTEFAIVLGEADRRRDSFGAASSTTWSATTFHEADLPHRHYLGKDSTEPDGAALLPRLTEAAVELGSYRPMSDHGGETVGLEDRVNLYDKAGRCATGPDHMLQLFVLVAMEAPSSMDRGCRADEKLKCCAHEAHQRQRAPKHRWRASIAARPRTGGAVKLCRELGKDHTETFRRHQGEMPTGAGRRALYLRTARLATRVRKSSSI